MFRLSRASRRRSGERNWMIRQPAWSGRRNRSPWSCASTRSAAPSRPSTWCGSAAARRSRRRSWTSENRYWTRVQLPAPPPRRRGTAPTDGHRRGPDRCAPRHPGPDGAQDARRDGAAARVRDSPPHRADQRRPAAAQRRYGVRVAPPAPAEGLDLRELGAFGEQPPSAPERLPARPAGWPARSSEGSRRSRNRSETRWGFRCSNRSSTTRATRCEGQRVGAALVAVRGSSPAGPLPSLT